MDKTCFLKRFLSFIVLAMLYVSLISAHNEGPGNDTIIDPILNELQIIRGIQEESQTLRKNAIITRQHKDSLRNRSNDPEILSDYAFMSMIEENTHQDDIKDGWNLYGWIAFGIGIFSLAVAIYTLFAQKKTEGNTKKLSQDMQRALLVELTRHLYRNLIIINAIRSKMIDIDYKGYPSEEHFEKLKIPMNNIHLESFYGNDKHFQTMHNLYLNLRNYNEEITVAEKHFVNPMLSKKTKEEDLDTLEFKVFFLTERILETIYRIWGYVDDSIDDDNARKERMDKEPRNKKLKEDIKKQIQVALKGLTSESNNIDVEGSGKFKPISLEDIKNTSYSRLYDDSELIKICEAINHDIHEERKKNSRAAWKLRVIRY